MHAHVHRENVKRALTENEPKPRKIHVYLFRYTDKSKILKAAANSLNENGSYDWEIFIPDGVYKVLCRKEKERLRRDHLNEMKARERVQFAFIPWSIPV